MAWKPGPLPPDTWGWGGVVPVGEETGYGFYFADFKGNSVEILGGKEGSNRVLTPTEVAYYDNSLELPPHTKGRAR